MSADITTHQHHYIPRGHSGFLYCDSCFERVDAETQIKALTLTLANAACVVVQDHSLPMEEQIKLMEIAAAIINAARVGVRHD